MSRRANGSIENQTDAAEVDDEVFDEEEVLANSNRDEELRRRAFILEETAKFRATFSTTYQATVKKLLGEQQRLKLKATAQGGGHNVSQSVYVDGESADTNGASSAARVNAEMRQLLKQKARMKWNKIRITLEMIRSDRLASKMSTGWETLFNKVRLFLEAERKRRDLYARYGFNGLPSGKYPTNNPMSLYPASQFPRGYESEIPPNAATVIRMTRHEIARIFISRGEDVSSSRSIKQTAAQRERFIKFIEGQRDKNFTLDASDETDFLGSLHA